MDHPHPIMTGFFMLVCAALSCAQDQKSGVLTLPNAILLQGFGTQIGTPLFVSEPDKTIALSGVAGARVAFIYGLASDGKSVFGLLCKYEDQSKCSAARAMTGSLATLSISTGKWTEIVDVDRAQGVVAMSRDGSKMAFVSIDGLYVVDVSARSKQLADPNMTLAEQMSWSPDNRRIAYEVSLPPRPRVNHRESQIRVLDVLSGRSQTLVAHGRGAVWSPSGQWIAYLDDSDGLGGKRCMVVRPDGTNAHVVATAARSFWGRNGLFGTRGFFWNTPVWSPDSTRLLLNVYWDWETLNTSVYELDIATRKLKLLRRNAYLVRDWAAAR